MTEKEAREILQLEDGETLAQTQESIATGRKRLVSEIAKTPAGPERDELLAQLDKVDRAVATLEKSNRTVTRPNKRKASKTPLVLGLVVLLAVLGGIAFYVQGEAAREAERQRLAELVTEKEPIVLAALDQRQWPEAEMVIAELKEAGVDDLELKTWTERLERGKAEELRQRLAFLDGEARAAISAEDYEKADSRLAEIRELESDFAGIEELSLLIEEGRKKQAIQTARKTFETAMAERDWDSAAAAVSSLESLEFNESELTAFRSQITAGQEKQKADRAQSVALTEEARLLDQGAYSPEAMDKLNKALVLDPQNAQAQALMEKMSAYTRTIRVPGDFPTLDAALGEARGKDEIILGEGTFTTSVQLNAGLRLRGAGYDKTFIQCPATESSVVTVGNGPDQSIISNLCLQHTGFEYAGERFAVLTVLGSPVSLSSVKVLNAGGHGAAVLQGGKLTANNCRFTGASWSGVAVSGQGSIANLTNCRLSENFHNGLIVWDSGVANVNDTQIDLNNRSGAAFSSNATSVLQQSRFEKNRDAGIVFQPGAAVKMSNSVASQNSVAGVVIYPGSQVELVGNTMTNNNTAGIVIGKDAALKSESGNKVSGNRLTQRLIEADLRVAE